ncbi:flavin-containing monooxygenase FMO GS-OX-like 9 isoform X1 [Benincasa hispida]|uniref:flavin-containing monooxygenase FMO GS-OX-like 9 isoform X1 n=1 Tax=Benincasa hispida TaxID=102211 RepID=UPI0018FF3D09|nr:flavin-containing monooxygenase FMO GS-OX-like 9 isoform X1 [Benincasa hispida]
MVSERSIIGIESLKTKKKVCVIGAGASGLVAARELRKEGHKVVILEQNDDVGGQWLYNPNVENEHPLGKSKFLNVHTSIYSSLRLASPREIMGFSDFPFVTKKGRDTRRFPGHNELLLYLKDFSQYFGLNQLIRFNTRVEYVGIMNNKNGCFGGIKDDHHLQWVVRSRDYCKYKMDNIHGNDDRDLIEQVFDAVVVATGHYSHPRLPTIKGMDKWKRKQIHSHVYRVPDPFRNEVVVVVGNSQSGQDISLDLIEVAKEIHLSTKSINTITQGLSKVIQKYENMHLEPQIEFLEEDGRVVFVDGTSIVADTILYCTGYSYAFPFLDTKGIVVVDDDRVGPLYEHTFPPSLAPSLSFIGIPRKLIGFPFFESQAIWIAQLLSGKRTLPSCDDMMQSIKEFYHSKDIAGIPKHNTHDLAEFEYCDKYGDNVGYPRLEEWRKKLCLTTIVNSSNNLETFRDSMDDDEDLQEAYQSPHFTQLGAQVFPLVHM